MWKKISIDKVGSIEKMVGEFEIWMPEMLPYAKMKIKVYEDRNGKYTGYTDVRIIRKFDGSPEGAVGWGNSVEEALENTINYFIEMVEEDYAGRLEEENIEYTEYSDF